MSSELAKMEEPLDIFDIFDFKKHKVVYDMLAMHYFGVELYIRSAILIDYLFGHHISQRDVDEFLKNEAIHYDKRKMSNFTNQFSIEHLLEQWYVHYNKNLVKNVPDILKKYSTYESELFNRLYIKYVDENFEKTLLWF